MPKRSLITGVSCQDGAYLFWLFEIFYMFKIFKKNKVHLLGLNKIWVPGREFYYIKKI